MGEAKRKREAAEAEARLLTALNANSVGPPPLPGFECVQALVIALEQADSAREALGALPAIVTKFLNDAEEMRATAADGGEAPGAICWERWPSGRQSVHLLRTPDSDVRAAYLEGNYFDAGARGYLLRVCAFPPEGWGEALGVIQDQLAGDLREVVDLMEKAPTVSHVSPRSGYCLITIPRVDDDGLCAGTAAQILRILDGMAAGKEAMLSNFGALRLSFDGHDEDPREVWDIDQPRQLLTRLNFHAPWWPWFVAPEQVYVWLGALLAKSPTVVSSTMQVSFEFDDEAGETLIARAVEDCVAALQAADVDVTSNANMEKMSAVMLLLREALDQVKQVGEDLQTGAAKPAEADEVLEFQHQRAGAGTDLADAMQALLKLQYVVVLDRSERGRQVLELVEANSAAFPAVVRAELSTWRQGEGALALISGRPGDGESWTFHTSGSGDHELLRTVELVTVAAMKAKASLAWTMGVSDALVEKLSPLVRAAAVKEAERLGLPAGAESVGFDTQLHRGLLDLAIAPGGQEVDFDLVQILDPKVFGEVAELGMAEWSEQFAKVRSGEIDLDDVDNSALDVRAWEREDGSLLIREIKPPMKEVLAPSGTWRLLEPTERRQIEKEAQVRMSAVPTEELEKIAQTFNESVESRDRHRKVWDEAVAHTTSVLGLFGRESSSLLLLRNMIEEKEDAIDLADRWLQTDQAYYLFWRAKDGRAAAIIADDEEGLLSKALPDALQLGDSPQSTLLVVVTGTSVDAKAAKWWTEHGGLFGHKMPTDH